MAWLTLDERRVEQRRNGFLPCIIHDKKETVEEEEPRFSNWAQAIMSLTSNILKKRLVQVTKYSYVPCLVI